MLRKETAGRTKRRFTYEEALSLFPRVRNRTASAVEAIEELLGEGSNAHEEGQEQPAAYQRIVTEWAEEIMSFGLDVKGLWLVDFDSGGGYYCWRYPESSLEFFHGYDESFSGRVRLN